MVGYGSFGTVWHCMKRIQHTGVVDGDSGQNEAFRIYEVDQLCKPRCSAQQFWQGVGKLGINHHLWHKAFICSGNPLSSAGQQS